MRGPDKESDLERGCPALAWVSAADNATEVLAAAFGVELPPDAGTPAPTDEELVVRCWKLAKRDTGVPDHQASCAAWLVNGPFHPFWRWWQLAIVHLRPIPGVKPAHVQFPGASHEVLIASIDPTRLREPDVEKIERGKQTLPYLQPLDLVHQVILASDAQAEELADLMIAPILAGSYSPDSDFRSAWKSILDRTAEHLRLDGHPGE